MPENVTIPMLSGDKEFGTIPAKPVSKKPHNWQSVEPPNSSKTIWDNSSA